MQNVLLLARGPIFEGPDRAPGREGGAVCFFTSTAFFLGSRRPWVRHTYNALDAIIGVIIFLPFHLLALVSDTVGPLHMGMLYNARIAKKLKQADLLNDNDNINFEAVLGLGQGLARAPNQVG